MKFFKITKYNEYLMILDEDDFKSSIFCDLPRHLEQKSWEDISFVFDEYEKEPDVLHELFYFLEANGIHLENVNECVDTYQIDDMKYALINMEDGSKGICVCKSDINNFERMY